MKKVLVDTSVVIDFLRRKDKENSLFFTLVQHKYQLFLSIVTHTELYAGKSVWVKRKAQEELQTLFSGSELLPLREEVSKKAGEIKARYNSSLLDAIIAATAFVHRLPLVTLNEKDFDKIADITLFLKEKVA